jgi:hypothetical protein
MELLFVTLGGCIIGLLARYTLPHRHLHGSVLVPAFGAGLAAALWVALTWAGLKWNGGWIWWITILGTAVFSFGFDLVLGALRSRRDERDLETLTRTGVATA